MPLRVTKSTRGQNWRIRGTHFGVLVDRSSRTPVRAEAEAVARRWEQEIFEQNVLGKRPAHPFSQAVMDYVTAGGETTYLEPLVRHFKDTDVAELRQSDLDAAARLLHPGTSPSTKLRRIYTPFIAIMRLAAANDHCALRAWRRPRQPQGRTDWRTPEEIETLLSELGPNMAALTTFLVGCFPRISEALNMRRRDISPGLERATFWETKGGYARSGPIPPRAQDAVAHILRRQAVPDATLWVNESGAAWHRYHAVNLNLKRACARAGIEPLSAHTLRHTGATWRYAATKDLTHLMSAGGWRSLNMVQRYTHAGDDHLAAAAKRGGWCI